MDRLNGEVSLIQITKPKSQPKLEESVISESKPVKYPCPVCSQCFRTKNEIEAHLSSHVEGVPTSPHSGNIVTLDDDDSECSTKDLPYKCDLCLKGFRTAFNYNKHLKTHSKNSDPYNDTGSSFSCAVCGDNFVDKTEFVSHMKIHMTLKRRIGEDTEIIYKSKSSNNVTSKEVSSSKYSSVDYEINKVSTNSATSTQQIQCYHCLSTFKTIQALRNHEKTHRIKCPSCINTYFNTVEEQNQHNLTTHNLQEVKIESRLQDYEIISIPKKKPKLSDTYFETDITTTLLDSGDVVYSCDICGKQCKTIQALRNHEKSHLIKDNTEGPSVGQKIKQANKDFSSEASGNKIQCDSCEKTFKNPQALYAHQKSHQDTEYLLQHSCDVCFKVFKGKSALVSHLKTHQTKCDKCQIYFESDALLKLHEEQEHEIPTNEHSCEICFKVFKSKAAVVSHSKTHDGESCKRVQCEHCLKYFMSEEKLKLHEYNEHFLVIKNKIAPEFGKSTKNSVKNKVICDVCNKEFKTTQALGNHKACRHVQCQHCLKYFDSEATLKLHEYSEHFRVIREKISCPKTGTSGSAKNPIFCTICMKGFLNADTFKKHEKTHKVQCKQCSKYFDSEEVLKVHQVCKHSTDFGAEEDWSQMTIKTEPDVKPDIKKISIQRPTCPICFKTFKTNNALVAHSSEHESKSELKIVLKNLKMEKDDYTKKLKGNKKVKGFKCDLCPRTFTVYAGFMSHKKSHKVQCKICSKQFKSKSALFKHNQVHKNVCEHCLKVFKSEKALRYHNNKEHLTPKPEQDKNVSQPTSIEVTLKEIVKEPKQKKMVVSSSTKENIIQKPTKDKKMYEPKAKENVIQKPVKDKKMSEPRVAPVILKIKDIAKEPKKNKAMFSCKLCPLKFKKQILCESHEKTHKPSCDKCSKVFLNTGLLKIHLQKAHPKPMQAVVDKKKILDEKKPNTCDICSKVFKKPSALAKHAKTHRPKCIECMETFETLAEYHKHEEKMHINQKKLEKTPEDLLEQILNDTNKLDQDELNTSNEFFCNICLRVFRSRGALTSHEKLHASDNFEQDLLLVEEEDDMVINSCILCQKVFKTRSALISHLKVHQSNDNVVDVEEPPVIVVDNVPTPLPPKKEDTDFTCDSCYKVCKNRKHLQNHMKCHQVKCRKCGQYFENKDFLKIHQAEYHKIEEEVPEIKVEPEEILNMIHSCPTCFKTFKNQPSLKTHLKTHHIKCEKCNVEFETKELMLLHSDECRPVTLQTELDLVIQEPPVEQPVKPLHKCETCFKEFQKKSALVSHKRAHQKPCGMCTKVFESKELLAEHVKLEHVNIEPLKTEPVETQPQEELKGFICLSCDKYFKTKQELESHKATHNNTEKTFTCKICNAGFKIKKQLFAHKATVHANCRPFKCQECPKDFKLKQQLQNHIRSRHRDERPFGCHICGSRFKFKQGLQNHEKIHENAMDFECPVCQKKFKIKQQLQTHSLTHVNIRPFGCKLCSKAFKLKQQLDVHVQAVHNNERPFECPICDKKFQCKQQLTVHINVHSDNKDFQCIICAKSFSTHQSWEIHMKIHLDIKNFECDVCEEKFRTKQQLTVHKVARHSSANVPEATQLVGHSIVESFEPNKDKTFEETTQGIQDDFIRRFQEDCDEIENISEGDIENATVKGEDQKDVGNVVEDTTKNNIDIDLDKPSISSVSENQHTVLENLCNNVILDEVPAPTEIANVKENDNIESTITTQSDENQVDESYDDKIENILDTTIPNKLDQTDENNFDETEIDSPRKGSDCDEDTSTANVQSEESQQSPKLSEQLPTNIYEGASSSVYNVSDNNFNQSMDALVTKNQNELQTRYAPEFATLEPPMIQNQISAKALQANSNSGNNQQKSEPRNLYKSNYSSLPETSYVQSNESFNTSSRSEQFGNQNIYKPRFSLATNERVQDTSYLQTSNRAQEYNVLSEAPSGIYKPRFNLLMDQQANISNFLQADSSAGFMNLRATNDQQMTYSLEQLQQANYLQHDQPLAQQLTQRQYLNLNQTGEGQYINIPYGEQNSGNRYVDEMQKVQYKPYK